MTISSVVMVSPIPNVQFESVPPQYTRLVYVQRPATEDPMTPSRSSDTPPIVIDYYTDVLCVWAWIAQRRIDELVILHRVEQDRGSVPGFLFVRIRAFVPVFAIAGEAAIPRDVLDHDGARAPVLFRPCRFAVIEGARREADARRNLF